VAQFQQFLDANPEVKAQHTRLDNPGQIAEALQRLSPDDDGPRTMMTGYEAAMYCNWLSRQAGLPESEWVYPTGFHEIRAGRIPGRRAWRIHRFQPRCHNVKVGFARVLTRLADRAG